MIKPKTIRILKGLGLVVIVCLFAYSAINVFKESTEETIEKINAKADERQRISNLKLDSTKRALQALEAQANRLKGQLEIHDRNLDQFQSEHSSNINNLLNLKQNEKNYIPNASTAEQFNAIQRAKYIPYE